MPDPWHEHTTATVIADGNGNFTAKWYVDIIELNTTLFLTAEGDLGSYAETTFTDAALSLGANAVSAANICAGSLSVPIHSFTVTGSSSGGTVTAVSFVTTGTYATADLVNFKLYFTTTNAFSTSTLLATITSPIVAGTQTFPTFSQSIGNNTRYFWITMDVASTITDGHTIAVNATSNSNVTGSPSPTVGTSAASGTQTLKATPTTATVATTPLNYCGTLTSGSLGGNTPTVGTGAWSQVSGPSTTTFSAPISGTSTATASVAGIYVYRWTISNSASCTSSADITVNYYATPTTANIATTPLNCCGTLVSGSLGGNSPTVGTGAWTKFSGPGTVTFSNSTSASSTATVNVAGTYVLRWTISNGTYTPSTADVTVNYYATPTTATVGGTQNLCGILTSGS